MIKFIIRITSHSEIIRIAHEDIATIEVNANIVGLKDTNDHI